MKLIYNGVDIADSVQLFRCVHDMYASGQADTLKLLIDDEDKRWDIWDAKNGDEIKIVSNDVDTGTMFVSNLQFTDGFLSLTATSVPLSAFDKRNKTWRDITFLRIAKDIAQRHGLSFKAYHVTDKKYSLLQQRNESDVSFLNKRCALEGCAFLVFDKTLVLYAEKEMEATEPVETITLSDQDDFYISKRQGFGSCLLTAGKFPGIYRHGTGREYLPVVDFDVGSAAEANRFARNLLRQKNKQNQTGFKRLNEIDKGLAPASTIEIKSSQARSWNGPAFIEHVRNDYIYDKSKVFFRKGLDY